MWVSSASAADSRWAATARSARRALVCTTKATTTATTTKTTRATAFSGSEIVRVPTGWVKNQLSSSEDATAPTRAGPMPPSRATSTVRSR